MRVRVTPLLFVAVAACCVAASVGEKPRTVRDESSSLAALDHSRLYAGTGAGFQHQDHPTMVAAHGYDSHWVKMSVPDAALKLLDPSWEDPSVSIVSVTHANSSASTSMAQQLSRDISGRVSMFWQRQVGQEGVLEVRRVGQIKIEGLPCEQGRTGTYALPKGELVQAVQTQLEPEFSNSRHLVFTWEHDKSCGNWAGMAIVNTEPGERGLVWINGPSREQRIRESVLAHEFGHVFGFGHANYVKCIGAGGRRVADAPASSCKSREYGNGIDIMGGSGRLASVSAAGYVGGPWEGALNPVIVDPQTRADIWLDPLAGASGTKAALLVKGTKTYAVEYRRAEGYDRALSSDTRQVGPGVYVNVKFLNRSSVAPTALTVLEPQARATYAIDGHLSTGDGSGQGSWHLPHYEPLQLEDGSHFTVTHTGEQARVVYTPSGERPPAPERPSAPRSFKVKTNLASLAPVGSREPRVRYVHFSWQGDGKGTDFSLQVQFEGKWKPVRFKSVKPGQVEVRAVAKVSVSAGASFRLAAVNAAGQSPYVYSRLR